MKVKSFILFLALLCASYGNAQLTSLNTIAWLPSYAGFPGAGALSYGNFTINASGEKVSWVVQLHTTGTCAKIGFKLGTVTTGDTLKVGLYTVDTAGDPTATAYGGMTAGTQVVGNADDNVYFTVSLAGTASCVAGDIVAIVVEFNSFVAGNMVIAGGLGLTAGLSRSLFPYVNHFDGAWTKSVLNSPVFALEYSGTVYNPIVGTYPVSALLDTAYNVDTAGTDEIALRFKLAVPARLAYVGWFGLTDAGANYEIILYDGTTALETFAVDGDQDSAAATVRQASRYRLATPENLAAGTVYRVAIRPTTTNNVTLPRFTLPLAAAAGQLFGVEFYESSRVGLGSWTDTTTNVPIIFLGFDQFDLGGGSGAGRSYTFVGP